MSPEYSSISSPATSTNSNSAPNTPSSVQSVTQTGVLHYNNGVQNTPTHQVPSNNTKKTVNFPLKAKEDDNEIPPPNMAPFGNGNKKQPSTSARPTPPSTPETTNIDYSYGPIGPPNVNLTSCDDLSKISQPKSNFIDQYDFIKEQAEILSGRRNMSNNYNNNNYVSTKDLNPSNMPSYSHNNTYSNYNPFMPPFASRPPRIDHNQLPTNCHMPITSPNLYYNFLPGQAPPDSFTSILGLTPENQIRPSVLTPPHNNIYRPTHFYS